MSLLLEEDARMSLPAMYKIRQQFPGTVLEDIKKTIREEGRKPEIQGCIQPGQKVAVAVGSRGIRNLPVIVKATIGELQKMGAKPFIVSAMGSHGGGTEEGQREVLYGYGITEEAMGVPVVTSTEVIHLGKTSRGVEVYFDGAASQADVVVPINRIKLHTDFVSDIQSGLCKMLVIGLGNRRGCSAMHEEDFDHFGELIKEAAAMIMSKINVGFGVGILENAYDQTMKIEFIPSKDLISREIQLVKMARQSMPSIGIAEIDVLVVGAIGKDISGAGYDPNILGKSYILKEFVLPVPKINKMVLLDVTPASHGNAVGLGIFDIITKKVFDQLDYFAIYANGIATKCIDDCKIPLIAEDEEEALKVAIKVLRGADKNKLRIVKIKNTLDLEYIEVSQALLEEVKRNPHMEVCS